MKAALAHRPFAPDGWPVTGAGNLLLAVDTRRSVLAERSPGREARIGYCPYGHALQQPSTHACTGFNGQLREPQGWYHLGNGHRVYDPALRRFHRPDRLSPFGKGGLNAYAYCQGDPVNFTDPTGRALQDIHIGSFVFQSVALAVSLSFLIVPPLVQAGHLTWLATYGMGIAAPLGNVEMAATMLAAVSSSVGLAATSAQVPDPPLISSELMWIAGGMSMAAGLLKFGVYLAPTSGFAQGSRVHRLARFVHGDDILKAKSRARAAQEAMEMTTLNPPAAPLPPRAPRITQPPRAATRSTPKRGEEIRRSRRSPPDELETDV